MMAHRHLCEQTLAAAALVVQCMLAAFVLPVGFALNASLPSIPVWLPSLVVVGTLAAVFGWLGASRAGYIPPSLTPWATRNRTQQYPLHSRHACI